MNWKIWLAFICVQATGIWSIYSSTGHADIKLMIGWWLLLLPGTFAAVTVPFSWGIPGAVAVAVSANAVVWFSIVRFVQFFNGRFRARRN